ncbi:hypothetical protein IJ531_03430 [bacterium]|nr:hypothetical protein [bacterium]
MQDIDKNEEQDFEDFAPDDIEGVELDSDLANSEDAMERALKNIASQMGAAPEELKLETREEESEKEAEAEKEIEEDKKEPEIQPQENIENKESLSEDDNALGISKWEELNDENCVVKKYIIYISKDFIPQIDNMTTDERSAYINDAIQQKLDKNDEHKQIIEKRKTILHYIIAFIIVLALTPLALLWANKAIMATYENYKYSQENFEKLYKHRFEKDKAYMRSLQYNKELERKAKSVN